MVAVTVGVYLHQQSGLGRAEQNCTLSLQMPSCVYSTVQLPGAYLACTFKRMPDGRTKLCMEQAPPVKNTHSMQYNPV
jgi:hypothetical protein